MTPRFRLLSAPFLALLLFCSAAALSAETGSESARTTDDPQIEAKTLELLLKPLPKPQLLIEAEGWQALLQKKAQEIATAEIAVRRKNREIDKAGEAKELAEEASEKLDEAKNKVDKARQEQAPEALKKAEKAAREAKESIEELGQAEQTAEVAKKVKDQRTSLAEKGETLERTAEAAAEAQGTKEEAKVDLLKGITELREQRTALVDRLQVVLDALEDKTDEGDTKTLAQLRDYRLYAKAVSGIQVEVGDAKSAWITIKGWLLSSEGGQRWAINFAKFLGILFAAWLLSRFFSAGIRHALGRVSGTSRLLENFVVRSMRWIVMAIGLIMALAALEVSVTPLLAAVGAAGFVVAFAMQDTLSNFASGLMILFFKPFDEGEVIDAGGVSGKVESMNLVSTTVLTFDNKKMIVPNNRIWNDVITNITGVGERRVDMQFGIGYHADVDEALETLKAIVAEHPKVLQEPEPTIRMHALADSSVNFIVRPWARTEDYWEVYWDVTREVKQRFDAAGIGIPFPQRDVHLYIEDTKSRAALARASGNRQSPDDAPSREDGGLDGEEEPPSSA